MNWLEFFAAVFNSWPLAFVALCILFRSQVARIIGRISELNLPGGAGAKFREELREVIQARRDITDVGETPQLEARTTHTVEAGVTGEGKASVEIEAHSLNGEGRVGSTAPLTEIPSWEQVETVAEVSPAGAVMIAWREVERQLLAAADRLGLDISPRRLWLSAYPMSEIRQAVGPRVWDIITDLRNLRNQAAHLSS